MVFQLDDRVVQMIETSLDLPDIDPMESLSCHYPHTESSCRMHTRIISPCMTSCWGFQSRFGGKVEVVMAVDE